MKAVRLPLDLITLLQHFFLQWLEFNIASMKIDTRQQDANDKDQQAGCHTDGKESEKRHLAREEIRRPGCQPDEYHQACERDKGETPGVSCPAPYKISVYCTFEYQGLVRSVHGYTPG